MRSNKNQDGYSSRDPEVGNRGDKLNNQRQRIGYTDDRGTAEIEAKTAGYPENNPSRWLSDSIYCERKENPDYDPLIHLRRGARVTELRKVRGQKWVWVRVRKLGR